MIMHKIITPSSYAITLLLHTARSQLGSGNFMRGYRGIKSGISRFCQEESSFTAADLYFKTTDLFFHQSSQLCCRRRISVCSPLCLPEQEGKGSRMSNPVSKHSPNKSSLAKCSLIKEETIHQEKWLALERITYRDPTGRERTWESVKRTPRPTCKGAADAVASIAILNRLLHYDCIVLVKQFRPPLKRYTIEFPAGLIDPNESIEEAALRELKEETGFTGTVLQVSPGTALDPGISSSTVNFVHVQIDGNDHINSHPESHQDVGEFTQVILVPLNEMLDRLNEMAKEEDIIIDARVYMYASTLKQPHLGMACNRVTSSNGFYGNS